MAFGDKMVNYIGMGLSAVVGGVVGLVVYRRTMTRAAELAREERQQQGLSIDGDDDGGEGEGGYEDSDDAGSGHGRGRDQSGLMSTLMNPDDAEAAALMDDDDISLWGADDYELNRGPSADRRFTDEEAALEGHGATASRQPQR